MKSDNTEQGGKIHSSCIRFLSRGTVNTRMPKEAISD